MNDTWNTYFLKKYYDFPYRYYENNKEIATA